MFITLEGPDGSGKSTQATMLAEKLREMGFEVVHTREPGGTPIGDQIREVVHSLKNAEMDDKTETLLYISSRAQLVAQVIKPALSEAKIVVCDRYVDSQFAYQGFGRGFDLNKLRELNDFATGSLKPDLTLLFNIDPETGIQRREGSGEDINRLDRQALEFHQRVYEGYRLLAQENESGRWVIIDASRPIDEVAAETWRIVESKLWGRAAEGNLDSRRRI